MKFIADLHIHSRFSRATARNLDPFHLALWARKKGIMLIGTGDFTHPGWVSELRENLVEAEGNLFRLKPSLDEKVEADLPSSCRMPVRFLPSGEISCIYKKGGKTRKVHHLVLLPDFNAVERLNKRLDRIGNITSDGRPILGLDSRNLLEIVLEASERAFFIPAHIWTPWFSLFGSKSGFDAIEECFEDLTDHIHALETGLSSDPPMNRLIKAIDGYLLVSNSDAHSPGKLGREANIFDTALDYDRICEAMKTGNGFGGTLEFFPEEGKYHMDGHRKCRVRLEPEETWAHEGLCPSCGKPLTVGVLNRVMTLADRKNPRLTKPFYSLIPLSEVLSEILGCGPNAKKVQALYEDLLRALGPELHILQNTPLDGIEKTGGPLLAGAIGRMRRSEVIREGGYDGEYGIIRLFRESEKAELAGQGTLFKGSDRAPKRVKKTMNPEFVPPSPKKEKEDSTVSSLNPDQMEAVSFNGGHLLIVAGPGTGKTFTLTHRIAHVIRSGQAGTDQVLALTFTNKAAVEMQERLQALVGHSLAGDIRVCTFHGFCLDVLRAEGGILGLPDPFDLLSEQDVSLFLEQLVRDAGKTPGTADRLRKKLYSLKVGTLSEQPNPLADHELEALFIHYCRSLRKLGMLDLDDLEVETVRLLHGRPDIARRYGQKFPWIFVDEYQDTNPLQVRILKALVKSAEPDEDPHSPCALSPAPFAVRLCAIGDPDQAIYGFRGADVAGFLRFEEDFPGALTVRLTRNYRSAQSILDSAAALFNGRNRLLGSGERGGPVSLARCTTAEEEAEMIVEQIEKLMGGTTTFSLDSGRVASHEGARDISFGDIGVLYRLNAQGSAIEEALSRAGVPFVRSGEKPLVDRYPVHLIWRFLVASQNPGQVFFREAYRQSLCPLKLDLEKAMEQIDPEGPVLRLIEEVLSLHPLEELTSREAEDLNRFKEIAAAFGGDFRAFRDALSLRRGIDHELLIGDRVALMSLHAAKGLEWPVVFIAGCEEGLMPYTLFGDRNEEEEKRLFYVGLTRARTRVVLSWAARRTINGRPLNKGPSPFLDLLPQDLCAPLDRSGWKPKKKAHQQLGLFDLAK